MAQLNSIRALDNLFEESVTHALAHEHYIVHQILENLVFVLLTVGQILGKELFSVLECAPARSALIVVADRAVESPLRIDHLLEENVNKDLHLF